MSDPNREGCWMQMRVISAGAGIVAGCVSCPLFGFLYQNTDAAVWAGLSVIIVSMVFQLHLLYRNYRLENWHTGHSLAATRNFGLLSTAAGVAAAIYYFYLHFANSEPVFPISDNNMIPGVWAFMCVKWGLALSWYGHKYKLILDRDYTLM